MGAAHVLTLCGCNSFVYLYTPFLKLALIIFFLRQLKQMKGHSKPSWILSMLHTALPNSFGTITKIDELRRGIDFPRTYTFRTVQYGWSISNGNTCITFWNERACTYFYQKNQNYSKNVVQQKWIRVESKFTQFVGRELSTCLDKHRLYFLRTLNALLWCI